MNDNSLYFIYQYSDPLTQKIYYVGRSKNPEKRLYDHSHNKKSPCFGWIKDLASRGLKPTVMYLEVGKEERVCSERGKFYFLSHRREGHWIETQRPLLNINCNPRCINARWERLKFRRMV